MGTDDELRETITLTAQVPLPRPRAPEPTVELPVVDPAHYELLGEVARGGIGRIVRARDRRLGRDIAIKQLHERGLEEGRRSARRC